MCQPGYVPTPGKVSATCLDTGHWTNLLQCELPLLLLHGGTATPHQQVELLAFHNTSQVTSHGTGPGHTSVTCPCQKCLDMEIAEVPAVYKSLHNMVYQDADQSVLICNGLSEDSEATCHQWTVGNSSWQLHSYPNKPSGLQDTMCRINTDDWFQDRGECHLRDKGRYAAQMVHLAGSSHRTLAVSSSKFARLGARSVRQATS